MADWPDVEHQKADERARRRALAASTEIGARAFWLQHNLERGPDFRMDPDDTQTLVEDVRKLVANLAELGVLYDVRQVHARAEHDAERGETE